MLKVAIKHDFAGLALDIGFEADGGITALFGRSGAGKTTVINAVAGLIKPHSGTIQLDGRTLSGPKTFVPPHRRRIGYVFQDARLFPHLSVQQNLNFGRWFARRRDDPNRIIDMLGLSHLLDRRPARLSGGEKQRVAIGRALLSSPDLLLLDEPMAALDAARKAEIMPYLERLRDERLPILYVSHSLAEVARLANSVVLIDAGKVRAVGPPSAVLADPLAGQDGGAVIDVVVAANEADGLARLSFSGGDIFMPVSATVGARLRVHIRAQDVMIATQAPVQLSALNVLPAVVQSSVDEGAQTLVAMRVGEAQLSARITTRSARALGLEAGRPCFAIVKTMAIADQSFSVVSEGATTGASSDRSR